MQCPSCGHANPDGARYCNACAAPLFAGREERRLVSILFADVVASTRLATTMDPETLRALLGRFRDRARSTVAAYGGTFEKYIGDAAVAVFGMPHAHDDDPERAVRTALALRDAVGADPALAEIAIRCGVATGEIVGGVDATGDHIVTGDAVNLAARLQQAAQPGDILVAKRSVRGTEGRIRYEGPLTLAVKGRQSPTLAWRATGAPRPRPRRPRRGTSFIGRGADLALLRLIAGRAFDERRVHVVTITSPAGIGKSRLVQEFLDELDGHAQAPRVARTLCLPYGTSLAYGAMRGALRALASGARLSVDGLLRSAGIREESRRAMLAAAGLGADAQATLAREELAAAWRSLLAALAREHPLVLFCDDLHWASDGLLALFEDVVRLPLDLPLLLVFAARPDLFERRPDWPASRRDTVLVQLRPLSVAETEQLASELGGAALPASLRARIVERAEGNPFFVEEMVRAALAGQDVGAPLPDSVQSAILARLDQLPVDERRVVQAAAVVGRAFMPERLQAVDPGIDPGVAERALRSLVERDLMMPAEQGSFIFRHTFTRDVAVGTIPRAERAAAHVRFAEWLSRQRDPQLAELAAAHLEEAWSLREGLGAPPDETLRQRTIAALVGAADRAFHLHAMSVARQHLERALALATREAARLPIVERLADVIAREAPSQAADRYREVLALAERIGAAPNQRARLHRKLALFMARQHDQFGTATDADQIERHAERALELAPHDGEERALGLAALAFAKLRRGDDAGALRFVEEAYPLLREHASSALDDVTGSVLMQLGAWERYYEHAKARLQREDTLPTEERVEAYAALAGAAELVWRVEEWERAARRALELCGAADVGHARLHALHHNIHLRFRRDDWDGALELGDALRREWDRLGEAGASCNESACAALAEIYIRRGRPEVAPIFDANVIGRLPPTGFVVRRLRLRPDLERLRGIADRQTARPATRAWLHRLHPFAYAELLEALAAVADRERFAALLVTTPAALPPPCVAQVRRAHGRVAFVQGDIGRARSEFAAAYEAFRGLGLRWEMATAGALLSRVSTEREGEALREEARGILGALGDVVSVAETRVRTTRWRRFPPGPAMTAGASGASYPRVAEEPQGDVATRPASPTPPAP